MSVALCGCTLEGHHHQLLSVFVTTGAWTGKKTTRIVGQINVF